MPECVNISGIISYVPIVYLIHYALLLIAYVAVVRNIYVTISLSIDCNCAIP
jgi:hypothetical protein